MGWRDVNDGSSVLRTLVEFDEIGRDEFLSRHGFGKAKRYFLLRDGRLYDSKAIVGVAHGRQFGTKLGPDDFSGGEATVAPLLRKMGFVVIKDAEFDASLSPLVLVENEVTAGNLFDDWKDVTGERYHFPNQYRNRVRPGRPFVYYRGVRRRDGARGTPEYFGMGTIGSVFRDGDISDDVPKSGWKWFCGIEDFRLFPEPVPAKEDGEAIESIAQNQWSVAVRELSRPRYETIIGRSGLGAASSGQPSETIAPAELADISELVALRDGRKGTGHGLWPGGSDTKQTGDAAERSVLDYLARILSEKEAASLRWCAALGETPGWDLEYRDSEGRLTGVEVKGTKGKRFAGVILTSNEYSAAERMGDRYILALVTGVPRSPQICLVTDPIACIRAGTVAAQPSAWKLEWRANL